MGGTAEGGNMATGFLLQQHYERRRGETSKIAQ